MDVYSAARERRTVRRFTEKPVQEKALEECVNAARLSPTARNTQELEFIAVTNGKKVAQINEAVSFGGSVAKKGRQKGEDAKAFIIIVSDQEKADKEYVSMDAGIAAQTITLVAFGQGIGCCMMGAINREKIRQILSVPKDFHIELAIAMGYAAEKPVAVEAGKELAYWIGEEGELQVPKRKLEDVLHKNGF